MWPFKKRLRDQNAVQKYRDWLRRWFLGSGRVAAAGMVAAIVLAGITWAAINSWTNSAILTAGEKTSIGMVQEIDLDSYLDKPNITISQPGDRQTKQLDPGEDDKNSVPNGGWGNKSEAGLAGAKGGEAITAATLSLSLPVSGEQISSYGYYYSPVYDDYRFHAGVRMQTGDSRDVHPCLQGKVTDIQVTGGDEYTVVMDHGGGWVSKYQGLASVLAEKDGDLSTGDSLGVARANDDHRGEITFTLSLNGETVDPAPFFK